MSFKYSGPKAKIVLGRDFNFYDKASVTSTTFQDTCDMVITFSTQSVILTNESSTGSSTSVVEYSFNGNNLHGELDSSLPSRQMVFENRVVSKIWFRVKSGSSGPITIRVDAWAIR